MNITIYSNIPMTSTTSSTFFVQEVNMPHYVKMEDIFNNLILCLNQNKIEENNYTSKTKEIIKQHVKDLVLFSFYNKNDIHKIFTAFNYDLKNTDHENIWHYLSKSYFLDYVNNLNAISSFEAHQIGEVQIMLSEVIHKNLQNQKYVKLDGIKLSPLDCVDLYLPNCYQCLSSQENYILNPIHEAELVLLNDALEKESFSAEIKKQLANYVLNHVMDLAYDKLMLNQEVYEMTKPLVLNTLLNKLNEDPKLINHFYISLNSFLNSDMLTIYEKCLTPNIDLSTLELSVLIELGNKQFETTDFIFEKYPNLFENQSIIRTLFDLHLKDCTYATNLLNNKTQDIELEKLNLNKKIFNPNHNHFDSGCMDIFNHDIVAYFILSNNQDYYKLIKLNQFKHYDINNCENMITQLEEKKVLIDKTLLEKIRLEQTINHSQHAKNKIKI